MNATKTRRHATVSASNEPFTTANNNDKPAKPKLSTSINIDSEGASMTAAHTGTTLAIEVTQAKVEDLRISAEISGVYPPTLDDELLASVRALGIQNPLSVAPDGEVADGGRRLMAAKKLGLNTAPVIVRSTLQSATDKLEFALASNTAREKTNEIRVREFMAHLKVEKERARERMRANPAARKPVGKARDLAAARVGRSATTLETGVAVVRAIEEVSRTDAKKAESLRDKLNSKGIQSAYNEAVRLKLIKPSADNPNTANASQGSKLTLAQAVSRLEAVAEFLAKFDKAKMTDEVREALTEAVNKVAVAADALGLKA